MSTFFRDTRYIWYFLALLGLFFAGMFTQKVARGALSPVVVDRQWTLPARFEWQGAFTTGCAGWEVPDVTPFSEENPDLGFFFLSTDDEGGLLAVFDGPNGLTRVRGYRCAISTDFNAFPQERRPAPTEAPTHHE